MGELLRASADRQKKLLRSQHAEPKRQQPQQPKCSMCNDTGYKGEWLAEPYRHFKPKYEPCEARCEAATKNWNGCLTCGNTGKIKKTRMVKKIVTGGEKQSWIMSCISAAVQEDVEEEYYERCPASNCQFNS